MLQAQSIHVEAKTPVPGPYREGRWRVIAGNGFPFVVVAAIWEILAHAGIFPVRLFPPVEAVVETFVRLTVAGILPHHALGTVLRLLGGFILAAVAGVAVGIAMGQWRLGQEVFFPLGCLRAPIPGVASAPLFLLWFVVGHLSGGALCGFCSAVSRIFQHLTVSKRLQ